MIDLQKLRAGIGYVTQESVIFNDTVRNNVSLWDEDNSSSERVKSAVKIAHIGDYVEDLPDGLLSARP